MMECMSDELFPDATLKKEQERCAKAIKGLEKCYPNPKLALDFSTPLELLIALILAGQYRDSEVNKLTPALFKKYKSAQDWADASVEEIHGQLRRVTSAGNKANWIKACSETLVADFGGKVPDNIDDLLTLKGVGRKTANVLLGNAFGQQTIGVDRHVMRVSQRLGFTTNEDPNKIETDLRRIVPEKKRTKYCLMLQLHGRQVCTAPVPKCSACALAPLCPYPGSGQPKK